MFGWVLNQLVPNLVAGIALSDAKTMIGTVIAIVIVGLIWVIRWHRRRQSEGKPGVEPSHLIAGGLSGVIVCALIAVGGVLWKMKSTKLDAPAQISVFEPFAELYRLNPKLGKPLSNEQVALNAYFATYRQGIVIYLMPGNIHYVLPRDQTNRKVIISNVIEILDGSSPKDAQYFSDDWVREHLGIPADKKPPTGGIAVEWERNPSEWNWLGEREWQLGAQNQIQFQHFENGVIIGPFPNSFTTKTGWRNFAILFDSKTWTQMGTTRALTKPDVFP